MIFLKGKVATVIGHGECYEISMLSVKQRIIEMIEAGYTEFLFGGMGMFDTMCARIVCELKRTYDIRSYLVIPYLTFKKYERSLYDDIIYPEGFEKYHFKRAIVERNRYLVDSSACALYYVVHDRGGAFQTLSYAKISNILLIPLEK